MSVFRPGLFAGKVAIVTGEEAALSSLCIWLTLSDTQMKGGELSSTKPMAYLWLGGISGHEPCLAPLQALSSCLPANQSVPVAITIPLFYWSFDSLTDPSSVVLLTTQTPVPWAVIFN